MTNYRHLSGDGENAASGGGNSAYDGHDDKDDPCACSALDALSAHVAILDETSRIVAVNRSWRRFAAANGLAEEACTVGVDYLAVCNQAQGAEREIARAAADGIGAVLRGIKREFALEYPCHSPSIQRWFVMRVTRYLEGTALRVVIAHEDITQRKQAEELARAQQAELAHLSRVGSVGEMASSLAHEVNQPLAAIANYAGVCLDLLGTPGRWPAILVEGLQEIRNESRRASEIIRRLRDFVRKQPSQRQRADVNAIMREVVKMMHFELRRAGIEPRLELSDGLPGVMVDVVQIEQVLVNLIQNAVEAMSDAAEGERELVLRSSPSDNRVVRVSVKDTGCGILPELRERIFASFITTKPAGLGMGLAISRSIIESHGGRIQAIANQGRGMTFEFSLPAC